MVSRDIGAYIKPVHSLSPQEVDASANADGTGINRVDFLSACLLCSVGAATGSPTTQSHVFVLQESADDSTYTDVADKTVTVTEDDTTGRLNVDLSGLKKYVRLRYSSTSAFTGGSSPANTVSGVIVLGGAKELPAA